MHFLFECVMLDTIQNDYKTAKEMHIVKKGNLKREQIAQYIEEFCRQHGYPPSVREIGEAVGLRSPSTVHAHLNALHEQGVIHKDNNKTRAIRTTKPVGVPILGKVTAGQPILAFEEDCGTLPYMVNTSGTFFALKIRGDSMINAGILDGDFVVVRKQETAVSGQIVVALLEDEATVKRLKIQDGEIWLVPENPSYDPIDGNGCSIIGLVTAVVRNL